MTLLLLFFRTWLNHCASCIEFIIKNPCRIGTVVGNKGYRKIKMEYLRSTLHIFTRNIFKKEKQEEAMEFSRVDAYMNYVHKILVWEDPMVSWTVLGVLHFLFWYVFAFLTLRSIFVTLTLCRLIVYLEMRLYGVLFVTILIAFTIDTYFEHCGLKAQRTPSSDAVREVINIFTSTILYLQSLRKDNASLVCRSL